MTRIPPVRRLLMDAKALIQDPENWCRSNFAQSFKGRPVAIMSSLACKFCAEGAVYRAGGDIDGDREYRALNRLQDETDNNCVPAFNDAPSTSHPMIMRLFNKAIRRAKEQGI